MKEQVRAIDVAKKKGLFLKVVTSVKSFDNYNSFFNIFSEHEEPCRRILVLTPYEELEEVNDENPSQEVIPGSMVDGNIWIGEYELTTNPNKINLNEIMIDAVLVK